MPFAWKTVRVFISSTFRDMCAERYHLVRVVFPKLRRELLQRRIHLVDVDLRRGVTSEQDALSVCREVVDECRPRFLCMLGGRYGWVPSGKTRSITADEVHYGVLDRDLKDRGFAYFYLRDPSASAAMVEVAPGEFREPAGSHGPVALAELKTAISEAGLQPFIYRAQWDDQSRRLIGLKEFGDRVYADLKQSIDQQFGLATGKKRGISAQIESHGAMPPLDQERLRHREFAQRRAHEFTGQAEPLAAIERCLAPSSEATVPLVVHAMSGSGKSALLAKSLGAAICGQRLELETTGTKSRELKAFSASSAPRRTRRMQELTLTASGTATNRSCVALPVLVAAPRGEVPR